MLKTLEDAPNGSRQGMEDLLHVIILFELVDQGQDLGSLIFRQFDRHRADGRPT